MADKISRRSFLKGTGKTILTAGVLSSGVALSTSTTPLKTVAPKAMTWKNLNVLTPKARAYRSYLRSVKNWTALATMKDSPSGTISGIFEAGKADSKKRFKSVLASTETKKVNKLLGEVKVKAPQLEGYLKENLSKKSLARTAFESAIEKPKSTSSLVNKVLKPQRTFSTSELGDRIFGSNKSLTKTERQLKIEAKDSLYQGARSKLSMEKHAARRNQKKIKIKSKGAKMGGGGKMALPGMESARNPTGMSLLTRRSILM